MEQKSQTKFLTWLGSEPRTWLGSEPRTSQVAAQNSTNRPPQTP